MKITIEAEPKEVAELLQAITSSKEQNITLDQKRLSDALEKVSVGQITGRTMA